MRISKSRLLITSFAINIILFLIFTVFIAKKGGVSYLERRITLTLSGEFTSNATLADKMIVSGLPGFDKPHQLLHRLPAELRYQVRPALWEVSTYPSGGRIRFRTNSSTIGIQAFTPNPRTDCERNCLANIGVDFYVNNHYAGSAWPGESGGIDKTFAFETSEEKDITIYLPLGGPISIKEVKLSKNATIDSPTDLATLPPILYYGSSITQGALASNPGLSYPAILSRRLGVDFINLGFDSNGLGDVEIARFIATLELSMVVIDYWANPTPEVYAQTLPTFVAEIRRTNPKTPLIIITPFQPGEQYDRQKKQSIAENFVEVQTHAGDSAIFLFDGALMISQKNAHGLTDGLHPNSLGFSYCADALEPVIRRILSARLPIEIKVDPS